MVSSSSTGRLLLKPPSMTRVPGYRDGTHPENPGIKDEARIASNVRAAEGCMAKLEDAVNEYE